MKRDDNDDENESDNDDGGRKGNDDGEIMSSGKCVTPKPLLF